MTSAAAAADLPGQAAAEIALVGRSNVGKSSLINALARERVARTSAAPGKTRLANYYRLTRGGGAPFYLVDLPGYGYARAPREARGGLSGVEGRRQAAQQFAELTQAYFDGRRAAALLLVDARHPGLDTDLEAWQWLTTVVEDAVVVATKIDKLARGQRIRATRELESVFEHSVLPVSAVTGEGLDELWKLIDRLANSRKPQPRSRDSRPSRPPRAATAQPPRRR